MKDLCEVCEKIRPVGVCASSLGPVSFAYCVPCLKADAEPFRLLAWALHNVGGIDMPHAHEAAKAQFTAQIAGTLERTGKTREELLKAIEEAALDEARVMVKPYRGGGVISTAIQDLHKQIADEEEAFERGG